MPAASLHAPPITPPVDVPLPAIQELQHFGPIAVVVRRSSASSTRSRGRGRSTFTIPPIVAAGPLVIITIRSDRSTASSTSCVTISTVLPVAATILHELVLQPRARQRVERAERLVQQQHLRLHRERAGDADALLHAARNLVRELVLGVRESDEHRALRACDASGRPSISLAPNTRSTARWTLSKHVSHGSSE